jgi:hypothetical protein
LKCYLIDDLNFFCALATNGSFGFAKRWLVYRAKPNVPFVRLAKIVFKKCALGINKNTEALAFGVDCLMVHLSSYFMFISVVHTCCIVFKACR